MRTGIFKRIHMYYGQLENFLLMKKNNLILSLSWFTYLCFSASENKRSLAEFLIRLLRNEALPLKCRVRKSCVSAPQKIVFNFQLQWLLEYFFLKSVSYILRWRHWPTLTLPRKNNLSFYNISFHWIFERLSRTWSLTFIQYQQRHRNTKKMPYLFSSSMSLSSTLPDTLKRNPRYLPLLSHTMWEEKSFLEHFTWLFFCLIIYTYLRGNAKYTVINTEITQLC